MMSYRMLNRLCNVMTTGNASVIFENFKEVVDKILDEEKARLMTIHASAYRRTKRSSTLLTPLTRDESGVWLVKELEPKFAIPTAGPVSRIVVFSTGSGDLVETYAIVTYQSLEISAELYVLSGTLNSFVKVFNLPASGATLFHNFRISGSTYLISVEPDKDAKLKIGSDSTLYKFSDRNTDPTLPAPVLEYVQTIKARHPSAIDSWTDEFGTVYLAVADSSRGIECYRWEGSHFDKFYWIPSSNPRAIESFKIYNHVFLAVANHNDADGNFDTESYLYKLDVSTKGFYKYQTLLTSAASDVKHFSFEENKVVDNFLVFANMFKMEKDGFKNYNVPSVIYKLSKSYFVPFQCIQTSGAVQWLPIKADDSRKFLLAMLSYFEGLKIYQYDGWRFRLISVPSSHKYPIMSTSLVGLTHFQRNGELFIALSSGVSAPHNVFEVQFQHFNFLEDFYTSLENWCEAATDRLANQDLASLKKRYQSLPKLTDPTIRLEGPLIINGNLHVGGALSAKSAKITNSNNVKFLGDSIRTKIASISSRLSTLRQSINDLRLKIQNSLSKKGDNVVSGEMNVRNLTLKCSPVCSIGNIATRYINGKDLDQFAATSVDKTSHNLDKLPLKNLVVEGDLIVENMLNNRRVSEYVTTTGDHVITAPKSFSGDVVFGAPVSVETTIDGILFHKHNLLLKYGDQVIKGRYSLSDAKVSSLEAGLINGVNISSFYDDAILTRGSFYLQDIKTFASDYGTPLTVKGDLSVNSGLINNLNLVELHSQALLRNSTKPQIVTGSYMYNSLNVLGDLETTRVNQLRIPEDVYLVDSNEVYTVDGGVVMKDVHFDTLNITERLNDIRVEEGKLKVWSVHEDVVLSGKKVFKKVDLNSPPEMALTSAELITLDAFTDVETTLYGDVWFDAPVTLNGKLNGMDFSDIINNAIPLSEDLPVDRRVEFRGGLEVQSLVTDNLNGVNPSRLLRNEGDQVVTAPMEFYNPVTFDKNISVGLVNGIKLYDMAKDVMTTGTDQDIPGNRTFTNGLRAHSLAAVLLDINGVSLDDLIFRDTDSYLESLVVHGDVVMEEGMLSHSFAVDGEVNGVHIQSLFEDSLFKDKRSQEVTGHKEIMELTAEALSTKGLINGFDMRSVAESILHKKRVVDLYEDLVFEGPVTINNLEFTGHLDGVSAAVYGGGWLTADTDQIIPGDAVFLQPIVVDNVDIPSSVVSGVDLNRLFDNTAKIDENATFYSEISFNHVESTVPVEVRGKLSGVQISSEAVRKTDKVIKGNHTLNGLWRLDGDLWIDGFLNGRKVEDICALKHAPLSPKLTIEGDVIFHGPVVVDDKINGKRLPELLDDLWLKNKDINLLRPVKFDKMRIESLNSALLNDINIDNIFSNYVSITGPQLQVLHGVYTFEEPLTVVGSMSATNILTPLVNGVDLTKLAQDTLLNTDGEEIRNIREMDTLIIQGSLTTKTINGLNLSRDFAIHGQPNTIKAPKIFQGPVVMKNLNVPPGVKIQGVDVSEWAKSALLTTGGFNMSSKKFNNLKVRGHLLVEGLVNGLKFDKEHVLLKSGNQTVMGPVSIQPTCNAEGGDHGCSVEFDNLNVLGMDGEMTILDAISNAIVTDEINLITGVKNFTVPPLIGSASVRGLVKGVDLKELYSLISNPIDTTKLARMLSFLESSMKTISPALKSKAVTFDYFEIAQEFENTTANEVHYFSMSDRSEHLDMLVFSSIWSNPNFYRWNKTTQSYISSSLALTDGKIRMLRFASLGSTQLLFTVLSMHLANETTAAVPPPFDEPDYVRIHSFSSAKQSFGLLQYLRVDNYVVEIVPFTNGKNLYMFLALRGKMNGSKASSLLYVLDQHSNRFLLQQKIETGGVTHSAFLRVKESSFLFLTSFGDSPQKQEIHLIIYSFQEELEMFDLFQKIPCSGCLHIDVVRYNNQHYIVTTRGLVSGRLSFGGIDIYKFCQEGRIFSRIQTIDVVGAVKSVFAVMPSSELYLYVFTESASNMKVFLFRGASGFTLQQSFKVSGASSFTVVSSEGLHHGLVFAGQAGRDALLDSVINPNKFYLAKFVGIK